MGAHTLVALQVSTKQTERPVGIVRHIHTNCNDINWESNEYIISSIGIIWKSEGIVRNLWICKNIMRIEIKSIMVVWETIGFVEITIGTVKQTTHSTYTSLSPEISHCAVWVEYVKYMLTHIRTDGSAVQGWEMRFPFHFDYSCIRNTLQ